MHTRVRTKLLTGDAAFWDGRDGHDLRTLAGGRFERTDGDVALLRGADGRLIRVEPGHTVVWWDGTPFPVVYSEGALETIAEEAP